ncbi:twinkle protein [Nitrosospira sp. Nsp11]|uniref:DnaB-like helicase C-terminal domain-containing protein n=1 Tax=Nitrosospira sp. Nsp11 TaxID=1855338 RepID=UPI00091822B0|nr:DnaB-like helicase C-terminal domain-containing protein [Nitrosospira sp. Nsp11]SHM05545.1 twinkle protein [Nitrosospira sp. Nsp11]
MANPERGAQILDAAIERKPKLISPYVHSEEVLELWRNGMPSGDSTGWASLDQYYTVLPGQITTVTGWPGSGKSEFIDALLLNLSRRNWKFAVFSFENQPVAFHVTKMLEKISGKPFGAGPTTRITEDELCLLTEELHQSFAFTEATSGAFSLKDVLDAAQAFLTKFLDAKRGVVIDPWNELEHWRAGNLSETEYISQALSTVRNWARINQVHVWIVAHPQKVRREDGKLPVPRPDMISGSQHWWNKTDCALTVWRDAAFPDSQEVDIHIQKVRFKHIGRPGMVTLRYDRVTGRYHELRGR